MCFAVEISMVTSTLLWGIQSSGTGVAGKGGETDIVGNLHNLLSSLGSHDN